MWYRILAYYTVKRLHIYIYIYTRLYYCIRSFALLYKCVYTCQIKNDVACFYVRDVFNIKRPHELVYSIYFLVDFRESYLQASCSEDVNMMKTVRLHKHVTLVENRSYFVLDSVCVCA